MPNFVKSCAWEPSSVLQLKRMLPSFSPQIGRCRWISFVKSVISWCLILSNHAHESLVQYFSSNGCCLHFPSKLEDVAEFPLWKQWYHDASISQIIHMRTIAFALRIVHFLQNFHLSEYLKIFLWCFYEGFTGCQRTVKPPSTLLQKIR